MRVSEVHLSPPDDFKTPLQAKVYDTLKVLAIPFERVDTDNVVTMQDCWPINDRLGVRMVKSLFLCNAPKSRFYLLIMRGDRTFRSREVTDAVGSSRLSFAPVDMMEKMLGVSVAAATVLAKLMDPQDIVQVVFDNDVVSDEWYGCSDGTTSSYLRLRTRYIMDEFLPHIGHRPLIVKLDDG